MTVSQSQVMPRSDYGLMTKSLLMWTGILTVCLLIVGFPIGILIVTVGSFLAVILHSVVPSVGILVVAGGFVAVQLIGVVLMAAVLTLKGVHPHNVSWLPWLQGKADPRHESKYAACPLTCSLNP